MASLGDLVVNLVADSSRFQKGMKEAETHLNAFAAATAAFAAASVARFMAVGSSFDDMTQRTGISVEALSGLAHAAQMSDTSMESLQSALVKMNKTIEDAVDGSATASASLRKLGLTTSQLKALSPEVQFQVIADALNAIQDPGERAAVAMDIFGKGVADIRILLNEGSAGIQKFMKDAEDAGLIMSGETAAAAAATADAFDTMLKSVDMAVVKIGGELAPIVKAAASVLTTLVSAGGQFNTVIGVTAVAIGGAIVAMKAITLATQAYAKAQAIATALSGPKGWIVLGTAMAAAAGTTILLTAEFDRQNAALERQAEAAKAAEQAQRGLQNAMNGGGAAKPKTDFEARGERLADLQKQYDELTTNSAQGQIDAFRLKMNKLTDDFRTLDLYGETALTPEQFAKYKQAAIDAFSGAADRIQDMTKELAVLRGETTAQEQELSRMAAMGANPAQVQQLRDMYAEREKLLAQQREEQKMAEESLRAIEEQAAAERAAAAAAESRAAAIIESIKTPEQKLADQLAEINALRKEGLLTAEQAAKAAEMAKLDASGQSQKGASSEPRFAQAMLKGSAEAYSAILRATATSPEVAATKEQTKVLGKKLDKIAQKPGVNVGVKQEFAA